MLENSLSPLPSPTTLPPALSLAHLEPSWPNFLVYFQCPLEAMDWVSNLFLPLLGAMGTAGGGGGRGGRSGHGFHSP